MPGDRRSKVAPRTRHLLCVPRRCAVQIGFDELQPDDGRRPNTSGPPRFPRRREVFAPRPDPCSTFSRNCSEQRRASFWRLPEPDSVIGDRGAGPPECGKNYRNRLHLHPPN